MPYDNNDLKNPTNLAGARRLLNSPKALDEALDNGLDRPAGGRGLEARGFSDAEMRKLRKDAGGSDM